jgi:hypothetical protein
MPLCLHDPLIRTVSSGQCGPKMTNARSRSTEHAAGGHERVTYRNLCCASDAVAGQAPVRGDPVQNEFTFRQMVNGISALFAVMTPDGG